MKKLFLFLSIACTAALSFSQTSFKAPVTAVAVGGAAGGDLGGTYPNPTVSDNSHAHTTTTISGLDLAADVGAFTSADLLGRLSNETGSASGTPLAVFNQNPSIAGATSSADFVFSAGTLDASSVMAGANTFSGTAETDTTTISGAGATDLYFVTILGSAAPLATDLFRVQVTDTGFVIHRSAAGTSGLGYIWLRVKL